MSQEARHLSHTQKVSAALNNEILTRRRVEVCEQSLDAIFEVLNRGFWGRLRWLILGR